MAAMNDSEQVRWWQKVIPTEGCWHWTAHLSREGYPRLQIGKRHRLAHRLAYETFVGPIPIGLTIDHLCNNPSCVNPSHLKPATVAENVMRGNGACVRNSKRTHCPEGHPLVDGNLIPSKGYRACLTCHRRVCRDYMRKKRAAKREG